MNIDLSIKIALRMYSVPYLWNQNVKEELKNISSKISNQTYVSRVDLRKLPFLTIDEESSHDFDDAIFCSFQKNSTWKILVAISDVTHYVLPGSAIDKEAARRGNSIYFPSRVIPMLPEKLSINICSLNPKKDRLVLICEIQLSLEGKIINYKHYEAVICSKARLTYMEVYKIWKGDKLFVLKYKNLLHELNKLLKLYNFLKNSEFFKKKMIFTSNEPKFILGLNHRVIKIVLISKNDVHQLIEYCMILANSVSAIFVEKFNEPVLFRDHEPPNKENISKLKIILKELNINLLEENFSKSLDFKNLLNKVKNQSNRELIQLILLRAMKPALYDVKNKGHFGLSLNAYVHFTSPIRRYPDLLLHRSIKNLLKNKIKKNKLQCFMGSFHYSLKKMKTLGFICSKNERRAEKVTRNVIDWLKCDFMKNKINACFKGTVINITNFGIFVRLNNFFIDVLLHISTFTDDNYFFDAKKNKLIGQLTKFEYCLGDILIVRITKVKLSKRRIQAVLKNN